MGAHIEAVSALTSHGARKPSARRLADAAARACIDHARRQPGDLDMLINAGLYREDNMGEPALAALIQEDIGANPGQPPVGGHGTFSFDLLNGTCGVIDAIHVEAGLLRSGVIGLGGIVTSDVDPNLAVPGSAPFRPCGGAMVLGWDDTSAGFTGFHTETFPEYEDLFTSGLMWRERHGPHAPAVRVPARSGPAVRLPGRAGSQSQMVIDARAGYAGRLVDCAVETTRRFLHRSALGIGDIDLLVPAPSAPEFVDPLRLRLGIAGDRVAYVAEDLSGAYTTATIAALQAAVRSGRLAEARNTLLLAAGAGITVALALYRQAPA